MATVVNDTLVSKKLILSLVETGSDGDTTTTRTFNRINPDATKEELIKAAKAVAGLIDKTVGGYYHSEKSLLQEVADEG